MLSACFPAVSDAPSLTVSSGVVGLEACYEAGEEPLIVWAGKVIDLEERSERCWKRKVL